MCDESKISNAAFGKNLFRTITTINKYNIKRVLNGPHHFIPTVYTRTLPVDFRIKCNKLTPEYLRMADNSNSNAFLGFSMPVEKIERNIAVIFATDVIGYSKRMETDEVETVQNIRVCEKILTALFDN